MKHPPKICIFCGNPGSSRQHIFPNRLRKILPRNATDHVSQKQQVHGTEVGNFISSREKRKQGHVGTTTCNKVCKPCNEGWMNEVELEAFPVLKYLIAGTKTDISLTETNLIRAFAANFFAVYDQDDCKNIAVSPSERKHIFDTHEPPSGWHLFVGRCEVPQDGLGVRHIGAQVNPTAPRDILLSTMAMGHLLIHCISFGSFPISFDAEKYANDMNLRVLHGRVDLSSLVELTYDDAVLLSDSVLELIKFLVGRMAGAASVGLPDKVEEIVAYIPGDELDGGGRSVWFELDRVEVLPNGKKRRQWKEAGIQD